MTGSRETKPRVQSQRWLVRCFYPSHHHVLLHGAGARNQLIHQATTDATPSRGRIDIYGMLDRVAVAIPWPEGGKRRVSQNIRAFGGDQNRKAGLPAFGEPGDSLLETGRLLVPDRRRVRHRVVVDPQDTGCVGLAGIAYLHHQSSQHQRNGNSRCVTIALLRSTPQRSSRLRANSNILTGVVCSPVCTLLLNEVIARSATCRPAVA
jgi:hypothetical protein